MKHSAASFVLLALSQTALAQQPPTAGGLLPAPVPSAPRAAPEIRIQPRTAATAPDPAAPKIRVRTLRVTGAQRFTEAQLVALSQFVPGAELALTDLEAMAARITEHYRRHGHFVAQAVLPAQDIRDETVTIAVSEGRLGNVTLRNASNLSDRVVRDVLAGLAPGDPIVSADFERPLLLLSDVPGVTAQSTLVPGTAAGTSDLLVDVVPGQRVTGSIDADNAGNRYTGATRLGATVNVNNPAGLGDVLSLRVLSSGKGLRYGRLSYQLQAGRNQLGVAFSHLDYALGKEFAPLGAHGTAQIASVFGRTPVLRTRNNNVYLQLALDAKRFEDRVDIVPALTERASRVATASVHGDHRDGFGGGGVNSYFVGLSVGTLDLRTPAARAMDAVTARTDGSFGKLSFNAMRLQRLGGPFSLHAAASGQLASKNLDVSEKMQLGGMHGVRAYPEGEAYADQGLLLSLEGRMDVAALQGRLPGQVQLIAFADAGTAAASKNPWTAGDNRRTLSGAGVGVHWAEPGNFVARAFVARKLGNEAPLSSPDRSARIWVQLVKFF